MTTAGILRSVQVGTPHQYRDVETAKALAACPLLNEWWQQLVMRRAEGKEP